MIDKLIEEFNKFFESEAKIILVDSNLRITIGSKTAIFSLPELIGGQNEPKD